MEKLSKSAEILLRQLIINNDNLSDFLASLFKKAEKNIKEDMKLRSTLKELREKGLFNCLWADNIPYLAELTHYADEYFDNTVDDELVFNREVMVNLLKEVANEYKIANVLIFSVPSCGRSQIGWEQTDEFEWRVKVEASDFMTVNSASKQIENKLRFYNYINIKSETIEKGTRKINTKYFKHDSTIKQEKNKKVDIQMLIDSLIESCVSLQANKHAKTGSENEITTYIRDLLTSRNLRVQDQTLRGKSSTGKQSGELDLLIVDNDNTPLLIAEAFKLYSLDKNTINEHIEKLFGYDTSGLETNVILVYTFAKNFQELFKKYIDLLSEIKLSYDFNKVMDKSSEKYSEIKILESIYKRSGLDRKIVHILVNLFD